MGDRPSLVSLEGGVPSLVRVGASGCSDVGALSSGGEREKRGLPKESTSIYELSPLGGTSPAAYHGGKRREPLPQEPITRSKSREMEPLSRQEAPLSDAVLLEEELKASRAEVACLQAQSDVFRRRMEFERAHYSQDGYVRALSNSLHMCGRSRGESAVEVFVSPCGVDPQVVARLEFPGVGAEVACAGWTCCLEFSTGVTYVGRFPNVRAGVAYVG
ncbi:hypothetical protein ACLOJK_004305 [Asimina triloba]